MSKKLNVKGFEPLGPFPVPCYFASTEIQEREELTGKPLKSNSHGSPARTAIPLPIPLSNPERCTFSFSLV